MTEGEKMNDKKDPVGIFDSGVGGISVLREAIKILPNENFIYIGDALHSPYGSKTREEVMELTHECIRFLMGKNVKAIVIACNTATSAADELREIYKDKLPILGIEPALKPAVLSTEGGTIVVMATERTLKEEKFHRLNEKYGKDRNVIKMPCPELVTLVEDGKGDSIETTEYIKEKFKDIDISQLMGIVLGCTHFPFAEKSIRRALGDIPLFDGANGISKHLKHILEEKNLLNDSAEKGSVKIYNTLNDDMVRLSEKMLRKK